MATIDIQNACSSKSVPAENLISHWASSALPNDNDNIEISIRIVERQEIQTLNKQYRHKDKATNVLSFPADLPEDCEIELLGDIAICADVVEDEAEQQNKTLHAHWSHMVIHGVLHLLGYDHIDDDDAKQMEEKEISILDELGFANPYLELELEPKQ